ncbi:MAG: hypothetical protein FWG75_01855 [Cystobacterineae bacterium]|nr:hypothetical protein [Cystobacterineae bacterium]
MAKSSKKHGAAKNTSLSHLEAAFFLYEAGNIVAARAQAKAFVQKAPEGLAVGLAVDSAWVAKLWPSPLPSPLPSGQVVAQALLAHMRPPPSAYAYALVCIAVAALLALGIFLRS